MIDEKYITLAREPFFEIAKELIKENHKVLDIGPGDGTFAKFCQKNDIYLLDQNELTVQTLKKDYPNVFLGKIPGLPFEKDFFNLIHISHVIEHLSPEQLYEALNDLNRCCKPGGAIVISTPLLWYGFYNDLSHRRPYNPMVLEKYLCRETNDNFSRNNISGKYEVERLQYRYIEEPENLHNYNFSKIGWIVKRTAIFIRRRLYKRFIKTGYTIVLRKK